MHRAQCDARVRHHVTVVLLCALGYEPLSAAHCARVVPAPRSAGVHRHGCCRLGVHRVRRRHRFCRRRYRR